jgi:hypothetical protein
LGNYTVGKIVRQHFPNASPQDINRMAKQIISKAHDIISPKSPSRAVKHE